MIDSTTLKLFGTFPREVGSPNRQPIYNLEDFKNFIDVHNGIHDCFTSLFTLDNQPDKLIFDFDGFYHGISDCLGFTKKLYCYLKTLDVDAIPVASGMKGFHIYAPIENNDYSERFCSSAFNDIAEKVFGEVHSTNVDVNGSVKHCLENKDGLLFLDPTSMIKRKMVRIPNTLRPPLNLNWCTYLPPDKFLDMTDTDIARHCKSAHLYSFDFKNCLNVEPTNKDTLKEVKQLPKENVSSNLPKLDIIFPNPVPVLKGMLIKELFEEIICVHPSHHARIAVTIELLKRFTQETVLDIYSKLDWEDFNSYKTRSQIMFIGKNYHFSYSQTRLKELGIIEAK